ncbi:hypothetical protein GGX14DRAFT_367022, partial [Mycena pura]
GSLIGDDPPRDRSSELRSIGFPTRHLKSPLCRTLHARIDCRRLCIDSDRFSGSYFPTIVFSVKMPFRACAFRGWKPKLPPEMRKLPHEDFMKSFDS